jgi:hypothetical protein
MLGKIERKQPFLFKKVKHGVVPLLFYFLVFCLLTYPLIFKFSNYFYTGARDGLQNRPLAEVNHLALLSSRL